MKPLLNWVPDNKEYRKYQDSQGFFRLGQLEAVPQGAVPVQMLFNIFINEMDDGTEGTLSKFVDDWRLEGADDTPYGCAVIQRESKKMEKLAERNFMQLNKGKCQFLHLGRNNVGHRIMWGNVK